MFKKAVKKVHNNSSNPFLKKKKLMYNYNQNAL